MKHIKQLASLLLAMVMVLGLSVTAFATGTDGSITLNNATVGEEYKIYKVFDLTYSGNGESGSETTDYNGVAYTYTSTDMGDSLLSALQDATDGPFELATTSTANVYTVSLKSGKGANDISSFLKTQATNGALAEYTTATKTGFNIETGKGSVAAATTLKWESLPYGYYYITSSLGSTVTINSTLKAVTIVDKNSVPAQDKKQAIDTQPTAATGYTDDQKEVQVGDKVWYQIEVTDGKGTDKAITITDTMSNGLTFNNDIKVYSSISGATEGEVTSNNDTWTTTSTPTGATFQIQLTATYVSTLNENDKVYIRFSATVNENAAKDTDASTETNKSKMEYSNQSTEDPVSVQTYKFQLDKVKNAENNYGDLLGAKFELYRSSKADTNKIWFVKDTTVTTGTPVLIVVGQGSTCSVSGAFSEIRLTDNTEDTDTNSLNSSKVIIKGLDRDTYILHETEAPRGYNLLASDETVLPDTLVVINDTISDGNGVNTDTSTVDTGVVSVINNSGTELPSTGGMGTTLFYIIGGILVVGAAVLLIVRRRMNARK